MESQTLGWLFVVLALVLLTVTAVRRTTEAIATVRDDTAIALNFLVDDLYQVMVVAATGAALVLLLPDVDWCYTLALGVVAGIGLLAVVIESCCELGKAIGRGLNRG